MAQPITVSRFFKVALGLVLALGLAAAGARIIQHKKQELARAEPPAMLPLAVRTDVVREGRLGESRRYLGVLQAKTIVQLSPRITAQITGIRVREGETVKKGEVLAVLDARIQDTKIRSLKAQIGAAKTSLYTTQGIYDRDLELYEQKALSKEALDRSQAALAAAKARVIELENALESARVERSYTRLAAPFDALVTKRLMEPGDTALAGRPVLTLEALDSGYTLVVHVPQAVFPRLQTNMPVKILAPAQGKEAAALEARISRLYPAGSSEGDPLPVCEIDLDTRPFTLPTGSSLHVRITVREESGLVLPARSLLEQAYAPTLVFALDRENQIRPVPVKVLVRNPDLVCVEGELTPGTRVVTAGEDVLLRLHEGQKVRPADQAGPTER